MNDDELRAALTRRASSRLSLDDRKDVIRSARLQATKSRPPQSILPRLAGFVAAAAAVLVLVIVALPILLSPPVARPSNTAVAEPSEAPASAALTTGQPRPTATPRGLPIYSAQELADKIGEPDWVGETVLADLSAGAISHVTCSSPVGSADACNLGSLSVVGANSSVTVGLRDATPSDGVQQDDGNGYRWVKRLAWPTDTGIYAFKVGSDAVEYLGPAILGPESEPTDISSLLGNPSDPSDSVYVASGWLTHTLEAPCAFPYEGLRSPMPDIGSYYCGGSWLTDEPATQPVSGLTIDGGLHVQGDAYNTFAVDSQPADGGGYQPREGIYLIRNAGCPLVVTGNCPVWRMVGRLDEQSPGSSPTPSPTALPNGITTYTAQQVSDMIGDSSWMGKTVLAQAQIDAARPVGCSTGVPCPLGLLHGVSGASTVTLGWRDATPDEGVQFDDGNGYHWVKQLELPPEPGLFAFTVREDAVEYLGPAYLSAEGDPGTVADLQGVSSTLPSDGVITVSGWLVKNWPPPPCAAPPEMLETPRPALDYYCYGTWLTPTSEGLSGSEGGVRVQNDAYELFAPAPSEDEHGVSPQEGVYLVRNAGCPIQAPCPAWRMVGRLEAGVGSTTSPTPSTSAVTPDSPVPTNTVPIRTSRPATACDDALLIGELVADPTWGLAVKPTEGDVLGVVGVVWPNGFSAVRMENGDISLLDENGNSLAVTGQTVRIGGGLKLDYAWAACGQIEVAHSVRPDLHVSNATTLRLNVLINGQQVATSDPQTESSVDPSAYAQPWHVSITTESGRQLLDMSYSASDVWSTSNSSTGVARRVDLSCGRLDVYAGPPLAGPAPAESFPPGDCDP